MDIQELRDRPVPGDNSPTNRNYQKLQTLLLALKERSIPEELVGAINAETDALNKTPNSARVSRSALQRKFTRIIRLVAKKLNLVPQNYHLTLWIGNGIGLIGIPLGVVLGVALGNMAFLGIGIPLGLSLGVAIGVRLDRQAADDGRQLPIRL